MTDKSILFFDDDPNNSNPSIDKNLGILFINIQGEKCMTTQRIKSYITKIKGLKKV